MFILDPTFSLHR